MDGKVTLAGKTQGKLLAEIFQLLVESGVCPETTPRQWVTLLLYLHHKGWLYAAADKNGHVHSVACGYRIPEVKDEFTDTLPKTEKGGILYVPFYASRQKKQLTALRILRAYLKDHKADVNEVAFYRLGKHGERQRLSRFKMKGVKVNG